MKYWTHIEGKVPTKRSFGTYVEGNSQNEAFDKAKEFIYELLSKEEIDIKDFIITNATIEKITE